MKTANSVKLVVTGIIITLGFLFMSTGVNSQEMLSRKKMPIRVQEQQFANIKHPEMPPITDDNEQLISNMPSQPQYVPGEVIIKLREIESKDVLLNKKYSYRKQKHDASISQLKAKYNLKDERPVFKGLHSRLKAKNISQDEAFGKVKASFSKRAPRNAEKNDLLPIYVLKTDENVLEICKKLKKDTDIEYVQPNYIYQLDVSPLPQDPYIPNDYYVEDDQNPGFWCQGSWGQDYPDLWGLRNIQAIEGFNLFDSNQNGVIDNGEKLPGEGVIVAVIDTGVDFSHEDLAGQIWINADEIPNNGLDDDENGYIDDTRGYDISDNDKDPSDYHGHGTHVSGTIAAKGNNTVGVIGVAPGAKIMAVKGFPSSYSDVLADCLEYAADNGANVLSNSWGYNSRYPSDPTIEDAVTYAHRAGCVIVFAAGNNNDDIAYYSPQNHPDTITVAATNCLDQKASFSSWGESLDVTAPWVNILSLRASETDMYGDGTHIVGTKYYRANGTSMACPHVAGLAAVILSASGSVGLNADDVREVIRDSADDIGDPGFDIYSGYGRINVYNAGARVQITPNGRVQLDSEIYPIGVSPFIVLLDSDLNTNSQLAETTAVEVKSTTEPAPMIVTLTETGPATSAFTGSIQLQLGSATPHDDILQISHDDVITVTYNETSPLETNVDTARIDVNPPMIVNTQSSDPSISLDGIGNIAISWQTDELATGKVSYGREAPPNVHKRNLEYVTNHTFTLTDIDVNVPYYFKVESQDIAGNIASDDNGDSFYQFIIIPPDIEITPLSLTFETLEGATATLTDTVTIENMSTSGTSDFLFAIPEPTQRWLHITPRNGNISAGSALDITVTIDPKEVRAGTRQGQIKMYNNTLAENPAFIPVQLIANPAPVAKFRSYRIIDDWSDRSYMGNGDRRLNPGERAEFQIEAENFSQTETARNVSATISLVQADSYITILDNGIDFGDIPPDTKKLSPNNFLVDVKSNTPPNHRFYFVIALTDSAGHQWQEEFQIAAITMLPAGPASREIKISTDTQNIVGRWDTQMGSDDKGHVYAVWYDYRNGYADIYLNYSMDYGATWQEKDIRLDTDEAGSAMSYFPQIICDENGNIYVTWVDDRHTANPGDDRDSSASIYCNYSSDYGATWQEEDIWIDGEETPRPTGYAKISCDAAGHIYIVWEQWPTYEAGTVVRFNRSMDYGKTWQGAIRLDNEYPGPEDSYMAGIANDENGNVYVTWQDFYGQAESNIFFKHSSDYGATWPEEETQISLDDDNPETFWPYPSDPAINCDNSGNIYIVWTHVKLSGMDDIYFNYSRDHGSTWRQDYGETPIQINAYEIPAFEVPYYRHMNLDNSGHIYIAWSNSRIRSEAGYWIYSDIYLNSSSNFGATWGAEEIRIDRDIPGRGLSLYPIINCENNGEVYITWDDLRNGYEDVYFNYSTDFGSSWLATDMQLNTSFYGDGTAGFSDSASDNNGNLYNAWVFLASDRPSYWTSDIYFIPVTVPMSFPTLTLPSTNFFVEEERPLEIIATAKNSRGTQVELFYDIQKLSAVLQGKLSTATFTTDFNEITKETTGVFRWTPAAGTIATYDPITFVTRDSTGKSVYRNIRITVTGPNVVPQIGSAIISPDPPVKGITLTASYTNWQDPDGPSIHPLYQWFVNGTAKAGSTASSLNTSMLNAGDDIHCIITPDDTRGSGTPKESNHVVLRANIVPQIDSATIGPDPAYRGVTLTASYTNWQDPDGPGIAPRYQWYVNNVLRSGSTAPTLNTSTLNTGSDVHCIITPKDTILSGVPKESNHVIIRNFTPTVELVSPNGGEIWRGVNLIKWRAHDEGGEILQASLFYKKGEGNWKLIHSNIPVNNIITPNYQNIDVGYSSAPAFCDIDGDADYDMFIGENDGNINFYRNDGTPQAANFASDSENYEEIDIGWNSVLAFCDIDGDADYDMFIGEVSGNINFYRNDGTPQAANFVSDNENYNGIDIGNNSAPAFCDIDGDDDYDMFIGESSGNINFYRNDGTPQAASFVLVSSSYANIDVGESSTPAFYDIDSDADYDMFIGEGNGNINFYRNDGTPQIANWTLVGEKYRNIDVGTNAAPVFIDIDSDSEFELFIGEYDGSIDLYDPNELPITSYAWDTKTADGDSTQYKVKVGVTDGAETAEDISADYFEIYNNIKTLMVDSYNDSNTADNSVHFWSGWGGSNAAAGDVTEVTLHAINEIINNRAKKFVYNCSNASDYLWYASLLWDSSNESSLRDVSNFNYLSLRVKGGQGGEDFAIELQYGMPIGGGPAPLCRLHSSDYFTVTNEWQEVNIPLSAFSTVDKTKLRAIAIIFDNSLTVKQGTVYVDNLEFSKGYEKPESTGAVKIDRSTKTLYVNNSPFTIKGVCYQPIPIGTIPSHPDNTAIYDRDFPLIRNMGSNAIRTWDVPGINLMNKASEYGLKVIAGFWMDWYADYNKQAVREDTKQAFRTFVSARKNSPALLMWALGDENNYHNGSNEAYYNLCNELAEIAYEIEGATYHPVIIVNGNLFNMGESELCADDMQLNFIDAWGCNMYLEDFDNIFWFSTIIPRDFFELYQEKSSKPIIITEYGADAYNNSDQKEDQDMQADWVKHNAEDILASQNACLGGSVMEYSDEWWKYQGDPDVSDSSHDNGGFNTVNWGDVAPDDFINLEYFGVVQIAPDGTWGHADGLDDIKKRKAYYTLRNVYGGPNDPPLLGSIGNKDAAEGAELVVNITTSDRDNDPLILEANYLAGSGPLVPIMPVTDMGASFTDNGDGTGKFMWRPNYRQAGTYKIIFTVKDPGGLGDAEEITITVINTPTPPEIKGLPILGQTIVYAGQPVTFTFQANDADPLDQFGVAIYNPLAVPGARIITNTDPDGSESIVERDTSGNPARYPQNGPGPFTFTWTPPAPIAQGYSVDVWFWAIDEHLDYTFAKATIIIAPDTQAPVVTTISPISGYITTNGKVPFKATIQDNAGLKSFRMLCYDHFSEAITGDIYINNIDSGMDYTLIGNGGYVNFPTQGLTSIQFEFKPKTAFFANTTYGSYTRHTYWIGVYDTSGNWTSSVTSFYIHQLGGGGGGGGGGCFLAGTPILMADRTTKPIEDIKVGDEILAYDENAREIKPDKVKRTFVFPEEPGYLIINKDIKVTPKHRFLMKRGQAPLTPFTHEKGSVPVYEWREAGSLKLGDKLLTSKDKLEPITSIERIEAKVTVYNLEVNPYHTFIADGVVVHNASTGGLVKAVAAPGPIAK